jgi:hypothetical protein
MREGILKAPLFLFKSLMSIGLVVKETMALDSTLAEMDQNGFQLDQLERRL